ncbi:MAG: sulfatase-like hydrolase/transferase [Anaerolineae bacterium]|nr:sulfatase-like hydrolase/transferase [Anaerolineae bacterium]
MFVDLLFVAAVVGLAIWAFRGLLLFFYYMSPVAIAMTVLVPYQATTMWSTPDGWDQEVVTATQSESQPAVFVLVFDGMGYDVLLNEDGELDAESFPNIAGLAREGVWFTNATSNYYWTKESVPSIFNPVKPLGKDLNVTLSSQYLHAEVRYIKDCGKTITCRGISYMTKHDQPRLAANLALRAFYQATPELVESTLSRPMGWFLDRLGWDFPSVDGSGGLTVSKRLFDMFLDDVNAEASPGRIHALHNNLPHPPFVFDREGDAIDSPSPEWGQDTFWERYRDQVMFADRLVGDLVSKLKSEGIYDQSVIVITSDHGERPFVPSPERPPDEFTPHVPLVIRAPGLNGDVSDVDYQHIDFAATLADILGLPSLSGNQGISAFSEERPQRDKVFSVDESTFIYSPEDDGWHLWPPDGTLLKGSSDAIYVAQGSLKRRIPNAVSLEAYGHQLENVEGIADSKLDGIPTGAPLLDVLADGNLLRGSGSEIYVMEGGAKRRLTGAGVMGPCHYGGDAVHVISDGLLEAIPSGVGLSGPPCPHLSPPDGTLAKGSEDRAYVMEGGFKRHIAGPAIFAECGYSRGNLNLIADSSLAGIPTGDDLTGVPCP